MIDQRSASETEPRNQRMVFGRSQKKEKTKGIRPNEERIWNRKCHGFAM